MNCEYMSKIETDPESSSWKVACREKGLVKSIKLFREIYSCGLLEAKRVIEAYSDILSKREKIKIVTLINGDELHILPTTSTSQFEVYRKSRVHIGIFTSDELLQVIANEASMSKVRL